MTNPAKEAQVLIDVLKDRVAAKETADAKAAALASVSASDLGTVT